MGKGAFTWPFHVGDGGEIATVAWGSDAETEVCIRAIIETQPGERDIFDDFGVTDPAFVGLYPEDIQACIGQYGPTGVSITGLEPVVENDTVQRVQVSWSADEDEIEMETEL